MEKRLPQCVIPGEEEHRSQAAGNGCINPLPPSIQTCISFRKELSTQHLSSSLSPWLHVPLRTFAQSALMLKGRFQLCKVQRWLSSLPSELTVGEVYPWYSVIFGQHSVCHENQFCVLNLANAPADGTFQRGRGNLVFSSWFLQAAKPSFSTYKYLFNPAQAYSSLYENIDYMQLFCYLVDKVHGSL